MPRISKANHIGGSSPSSMRLAMIHRRTQEEEKPRKEGIQLRGILRVRRERREERDAIVQALTVNLTSVPTDELRRCLVNILADFYIAETYDEVDDAVKVSCLRLNLPPSGEEFRRREHIEATKF